MFQTQRIHEAKHALRLLKHHLILALWSHHSLRLLSRASSSRCTNLHLHSQRTALFHSIWLCINCLQPCRQCYQLRLSHSCESILNWELRGHSYNQHSRHSYLLLFEGYPNPSLHLRPRSHWSSRRYSWLRTSQSHLRRHPGFFKRRSQRYRQVQNPLHYHYHLDVGLLRTSCHRRGHIHSLKVVGSLGLLSRHHAVPLYHWYDLDLKIWLAQDSNSSFDTYHLVKKWTSIGAIWRKSLILTI